MPTKTNFFYYALCNYCKTKLQKYQRCASCKSVSYCSEQHQALDWRSHKQLCKAITNCHKNIGYSSMFENWNDYRVHCHLLWKHQLKRDLVPFEYQVLMFPRLCAICYNIDSLKDCVDCGNVAYCSDEHMQQHKLAHEKYCMQLQLCMEVDQYLDRTKSYPHINTDLLVKVLPHSKNMHDILNLITELPSRPKACLTIEDALRSEAIAPGAIIYNALKHSDIIDCTRIIIHIVGASSLEATMDWGIVSELIFHSLNSLHEIVFVLIGPEAWLLSQHVSLCNTCLATKRIITLKVLDNLYHEVVDSIERPNLVVAFNCGLHEHQGEDNDNWKNSLSALIKYNVPLVFTSYTHEELTLDTNRFKTLKGGMHFLCYGENHFSSLRPVRDWCNKGVPVFYSHAFMGIAIQDN